jgi:hypothetical protein
MLIGALALTLVPPASAQVSASISGKVEDAAGGAISSATVQVKSLETGAVRETVTDASGNYRLLSLPVGQLEVRAQKEGFKAAVRTGIDVTVGQNAVVNLKMEVGEILQEVTVTAETPLINTTTSPVSGLVGEREVKELPLNGRSFDNLLTLNPGVINYTLKSPQTTTSNGNTFSVAGRRPMDNIFLLNGIEYTGSSQLSVTPGGASGDLLGIDAVREFNVLSETYSAEYGKRAGAQVTVVTQSGSNVLHASLFEFIRNSALDARNYFDRGAVAPFRRNQFGGSMGGPLKKDKLFLFGNYEGFRHSLGVSSVAVVPDEQARQGLLPNAQGVYVPVQNLNRAMLPFTSLWPEANGPELLVNGLPSGTALSYSNPNQTIREDFGTLRADYNIGAADTLAFSYTIDDGNNLTPQADPLFGAYNQLRSQVASLQETHVFTPSVLNTFTAGFSRAAYNFDSFSLAKFGPELSFLEGGEPGGIVIGGGTTTTGVAAITAAGPNNAAGAWNRRNLFTYSDTVQVSRGRHDLRFGGWFQRMQDNENTASRRLGQASFTSLTTFLQGTVSSFQIVPNPTELGWRSVFGAWFVQDAYRVLPNLTLQVGLRHEFTTGYNEVNGRGSNYITGPDGVLVTTPRVSSALFTENNAKKLFGPRVALAWDPFGDGKTAVRAGWGMYYSLIDNLAFLVNSLPPTNGSVSFANRSLFSFTPILPNVAVPPSCGPGVPTPCTTYAPQGVQADAKTPTVQEWNFTIEQQLTTNTALRVAYVGSFGYHGLLSVDPNTVPAAICANAAGCVSGGQGTARGSVPQGAQYIPVSSRPNPYVSAGFFWFTEGNSSYNGLQTDLIRRFSHGLQLRFNYTWSKNLDMNSGLTGAQANNQAQMVMDPRDPRRDWGPSALNVTHQASVSGRYELPFARNSRLGGWQLAGIATMLSGFPFTPQIGTNRSGNGDTRNPDRPSLNPAFTGDVIVGKQSQWFNPAAFILPSVGTWGNLGRGVFTGPGLANLDLSLMKNTRLTERVNLQIRAEFFNALNHTNLRTPNAIVFSGGNYSSSAGLITSTATTSRQIQFGMKLMF